MDNLTLLLGWVVVFFLGRLLIGVVFPNQNRRGQTQGRNNAVLTPQQMERINEVAIMFPNLSRQAIENDVRRTGSVQTTIENILAGNIQQQRSSSEAVGVPVSSSPSSYHNIIKNIDETSKVAEPPKVWSPDAKERQSLLIQRKQFMLQQAREKFNAQQTTAKSDASLPGPSSADMATSSSSQDSSSASASGRPDSVEERRQKTLEAVHRRTGASSSVD